MQNKVREMLSIKQDTQKYNYLLGDERVKNFLELYSNNPDFTIEDLVIQMYFMGYDDKKEEG